MTQHNAAVAATNNWIGGRLFGGCGSWTRLGIFRHSIHSFLHPTCCKNVNSCNLIFTFPFASYFLQKCWFTQFSTTD
jgi:hypothetical protein